MSKYKGPTRDKVAKTESARLATMRDAGISHVGILASPNPGEFCEECAAIMFTRDKDGTRFEIEFAPALPLPGCDKEFCKCLYIAVQ